VFNKLSKFHTPTRQSSNPWGLQIHLFTLFISPLHLAVINTAMGGHQAGSRKKQKPIRNSPAVSASSTHPPRGCPTPPVTPELPTRHGNNGELLFSQTSSTNSPPLPDPSSVTTASVASPAAANSASLAAAQVAPPQLAGHKCPKISQLSLDSKSGVERIKRSQLSLDSESLFSFLRAPLVVTLKTQRNGSSPRAAPVPNIVSTYTKNNVVPTKYKSTSKKTSHQATRCNNQAVTNSAPVTDQNANYLLSAHPNLPKGYNTGSIKPTFSLDSKTLRRYIVEDFLFASIGEQLLLLVANSYPSFASHWFCIYKEQDQGRNPLIFGDVLFFPIESVVLKNVYCSNFTGGIYTQKEFGALFSSRGGAALGLSFPGCPRSFEFELKSAHVFFSCETIQVWGTTKPVRSFRRQLSKLKNELSAELDGDKSQTLLLCNAYSSRLTSLSGQKTPPPTVGSSQLVESLSFGGPVYLSYSIKVDAVIASAVAACYGHFVTLTEPIILQSTINSLAAECHSSFPL
jgi:hypothetical protein